GLEVYAVEDVSSVDPVTGARRDYLPFYSFRHGGTRDSRRAFWCASRKPAARKTEAEGEAALDPGTDVWLSLVDLDFDPRVPSEPTLVVRTTCTNRQLPELLSRAGDEVRLDLEPAAPVSRVRCLGAPTPPLRVSPRRRGSYWRLVSHLSLNHLSLAEGE